jgi:DGQHR domain-containing protein
METKKQVKFSANLIRQGKYRFFTCTIPTDILAECSFVSTRDEDPKEGFQRLLDKKRAQEIADYIDNGLGTIPSSIVVSAQPNAKFKELGAGKTIEFEYNPKSLLILDGQHRVYGFLLAKTAIRVPVVIYNGLSRVQESRLFIDINTKQRPVPNELLLDIKNLAQYESINEAYLNELFNLFHSKSTSPLFGLLSPSKRSSGKISRVSFNTSIKPVMGAFADKESNQAYETLAPYLSAFIAGLKQNKCDDRITNPTVLRAVVLFFPEVAQRVKDKFGMYNSKAFGEILVPFFSKLSASKVKNSGYSHKELYDYFSNCFRTTFII